MGKRFTFSLVFLALSIVLCYSKQLSENEAKSIATSFMKKATSIQPLSSTLKLAYVGKKKQGSNDGMIYVFNKGLKDGYVIIAGDDRVENEVLGYSDNGAFDYNQIPENMKYWLGEYERQIEFMQKNAIEEKKVETKELSTSVAPLLGNIKWGQGSPYNLLCPTLANGKKAATGCTATALAQIMYYWRWPDVGVGSLTYQYSGQPQITADFSKSQYQWDTMLPVYNANSSEESRLAVAKLMSDVGVGVRASYGLSTSAAGTRVPIGMMDYFKYDKKMAYHHRAHYYAEEWEQMLRDELDAGHPVWYSGRDCDNSGHAFVCDGYTKDGYFHFNWGWNGSSNGYFLSNALNYYPMNLDYDFDFRQAIVKDIYPNQEGSVEQGYLIMNSWSLLTTECKLGETIYVSLKDFESDHWHLMNYNIALNLYKGDELVQSSEVSSNTFDYLEKIAEIQGSIVLPENLPDGEYKLYPQYKVPVEPVSAYRTMKMPISISRYMIIKIANGDVSIEQPVLASKLSVKSFTFDDVVCVDKVSRAYVTMINRGNVDYYNDLFVTIYNSSFSLVEASSKQMVLLKVGEEKTYEFDLPALAEAGDYYAILTNSEGSPIVTKSFSVQIVKGSANLQIIKSLTPASTEMPYYDISATAKIKNSGSFYAGNIELMIYGDNNIYLRLYDYINIDTSGEKEVSFKGSFEDAEIDKEYTMALRRYDVANKSQVWGSQVKFKVVSGSSAIEDVESCRSAVYPNPAESYVTIESAEPIVQVNIYSISGTEVLRQVYNEANNVNLDVSSLASGLYLLRITKCDGTKETIKLKKK